MLRTRSQAARAARQKSSVPCQVSPPPGEQPGLPSFPVKTVDVGRSAQPEKAINAYVEGNELVAVVPDPTSPNGVRLRRRRAEYSCQLKQEDVSELLRRMLRESRSVRAIRDEGDWTRVFWRTADDCRQYCKLLEEKGVQTYEGGIDPVLRWMADERVEVAPRRLGYLDLESDSRLPFSRMREMRILSWALVTDEGEFVEVLEEDDEEAERRLLLSLWRRLDVVDQIAAWNGDRFDFPLLKARTERHGIGVPWRRWLWLDHLELFKKQNTMAAESGEEKQSYALGAIGQAVLGEGKDDLDASQTYEIWSAGPDERARLAKYNLKDVQLMARIEAKTGYIALHGTLGEACGCFPDSRGMLASVQTEALLQRLAVQRGHRYVTIYKRRYKAAAGEQFKGAYVMDPAERGIVKNVHVADFSSLYPTIIRTWNMSTETVQSRRFKEREIASYVRKGARFPLIGDDECISPTTGIVFAREPEGMLSGAVAEMMRLRKAWNEKKAKATPGTAEWTDADRRSTSYKIAANSCYGATGMSSFRHYDVDVAESVSQCAVWLIKQTIAAAEDRGMQCIYCDTDSVFVSGCTKEEFGVFVGWCNDELYPRILRSVGCEPGLINLAYEKAFERVVFVQKKRYAGRYSHYKGTAATDESKPEVKGLEYKRGDSIRLARQVQEDIVDMLVGQVRGGIEEPSAYEEVLDRWRKRVLDDPLELDDVVIVKGLNKPLDGYAVKIKKDGTVARQLPHVEVAKILAARGRDVGEGSRISYVVIDGSVAPQKVIPAEDWRGEVDRFATWESLVAPPTIRVLEAAFPGHDWSAFKRARPGEKRRRKSSVVRPAGPDLFDAAKVEG